MSDAGSDSSHTIASATACNEEHNLQAAAEEAGGPVPSLVMWQGRDWVNIPAHAGFIRQPDNPLGVYMYKHPDLPLIVLVDISALEFGLYLMSPTITENQRNQTRGRLLFAMQGITMPSPSTVGNMPAWFIHALFVSRQGELSPEPCVRCRAMGRENGFGYAYPFAWCLRIGNMFGGACNNCIWAEYPRACSHYGMGGHEGLE